MGTTARVMTGLLAGIVIGILLAWSDPALASRIAGIVEPFGKLWLNALQMTVVPLVFALVVVGINQASDAAHSGRVARQAIVSFVILLTAAAAMTAVLAPLALSMLQPDPAVAAALRGHAEDIAKPSGGWADALIALVPSNAIAAAAQSAMLPLVVFALFFGFALTRIDATRHQRMLEFFQTIADVMIVIVHWVLWAAPLGVFALVLAVCAKAGSSVLSALGWYVVILSSIYVAVTLLLYPIAVLVGGERLRRWVPAILPAQIVAASTQSSLATLPAMLESARERLDHPRAASALVLPMAVSLFRITSPIQYIVVSAFIAWLYGIDVGVMQMGIAVVLAVVISLGSVGLPGQVSFMATNMPVSQALGLPIEPFGLLLAVDTIPDVFATLGNVTADLTATSVVTRQSRGDGDASAGAAGET